VSVHIVFAGRQDAEDVVAALVAAALAEPDESRAARWRQLAVTFADALDGLPAVPPADDPSPHRALRRL
jgi:hypothetical protein